MRPKYVRGPPEEGEHPQGTIDVSALPVETEDEQRFYASAVSQGVLDGTIELTPVQQRTLELRMRSLGMVGQGVGKTPATQPRKEDKGDPLAWDDDRHTAAGNSTDVKANRMAADAKGLTRH